MLYHLISFFMCMAYEDAYEFPVEVMDVHATFTPQPRWGITYPPMTVMGMDVWSSMYEEALPEGALDY